MDTQDTFEQKSQLEHVKLRPDTYMGSIDIDTQPMYIITNENDKKCFTLNDIEFPPGLIKIFDEVLVNASDRYTNYPKLVTYIKIDFDLETGVISVENDGPGILVILVKTLHDGDIYKPQAILSQFLSGSNFSKKESITGGKNGLGLKIVTAFSDKLDIETYDEENKILYKQTFTDRLNIIEPPKLETKAGKGHTKLTFLPSYTAFGYKKYSKKIGKIIYKLIEARAYQTAAFVKGGCEIWFNGEPIKFDKTQKNNLGSFAQMFITNDYGIYSTKLIHPTDNKLNMDICIGISDEKFQHVSIINGISVYKGGTHIKYISSQLTEYIIPKLEKLLPNGTKVTPTMILNKLFVFVRCSVFDAKFHSQSKTELTNPIAVFTGLKFTEKEWKKLWPILEPHIMEAVLGKLKDKTKSRVTRSKILLKKGNDAKFAGAKNPKADRLLFIAEGDSALGLTQSAINHKKTELDPNYCGTFSIQGVCINARKEVKGIEDKKNNKTVWIRNEKLQKNIRLNELVQITGLDYQKTYTFGTAEGDKEFKTLRYDYVVAATDADVDGKGQIFGLLMNFFALFWPELVKRGFVKRFNTPIIRAYPKKSSDFVMEFFALHEFDTWIETKFSGDLELATSKYDINYYKGLAGTTVEEIVPTFSNFKSKLNTYDLDETSLETLETYFGIDTNPRKHKLCTPIDKNDIIKCDNEIVPLTPFLNCDVKEFQRDNILRKLPHIIDGSVPSRRKTLCGARLNKKMATEKVKVVNFTGFVIEKTGYVHGDASLSKTIIKMAQNFVGTKNLPLLIGVGQFGTRKLGGEDAGSARYIYVKNNKLLNDALFPPQDDFLLKYVFEEGERCEPEYYVPILPMAVLESMQIPATGWRIRLWARDFSAVIKNVRRMVKCEIERCKKLPIWMNRNNCNIRTAGNGKQYMVGKYTYDEKTNIIKISELPLSVYNKKYINSVAISKDDTLIKEIKGFEDYSNFDEVNNIDQVDIQFEMQPGAIESIKERYDDAIKNKKLLIREPLSEKKEKVAKKKEEEKANSEEFKSSLVEYYDPNDYIADPLFDHIEEFFKLRLCINSDINMIGVNGEVMELDYYSTIVNVWFAERKRLYKERIERYVILSELKIRYLENIIRFTREKKEMNITDKTPVDKFTKILSGNKYDKFDKSLLLSPKYLLANQLKENILNGPNVSYNYIMDLTYRQTLSEACEKRSAELEAERKTLAELQKDCDESKGHFTGQKAWLRELDIIEPIIKNGVKNGWDRAKKPAKFK